MLLRRLTTGAPLWRLHPVAPRSDPRWRGRRAWEKVIVRAPSAARARRAAATWSAPPLPCRIGNESDGARSGFEDERLYGVEELGPAEAAGYAGAGAPEGVTAAVPSADAGPGQAGEPDIVYTGKRHVACDGGGTLGHPIVWYTLEGIDSLCCAYCGRIFVHDPGRAGSP